MSVSCSTSKYAVTNAATAAATALSVRADPERVRELPGPGAAHPVLHLPEKQGPRRAGRQGRGRCCRGRGGREEGGRCRGAGRRHDQQGRRRHRRRRQQGRRQPGVGGWVCAEAVEALPVGMMHSLKMRLPTELLVCR